MSDSNQAGLAPSIREFTYGVRDPKKTVKLYPLSLADQAKMTGLIQKVMNEGAKYAGNVDTPEQQLKFVTEMLTIIQQNIEQFIKLITDEGVVVDIGELTNDQFVELVMNVFEVNYENALKNFSGLFEKVRKVFPSKRSSLPFVSDTGDID